VTKGDNTHVVNSNFTMGSVIYEGVSKSFWTESVTKYTLAMINTH